MAHHTTRLARCTVATLPVLALTVAGLATTQGAATAQPRPAPEIGSSEHYINYAEAAVQPDVGTDIEITPDGRIVEHVPGGSTGTTVDATVQAASEELDAKFAGGNPAAAERLAQAEARAIEQGGSPADIRDRGTARALADGSDAVRPGKHHGKKGPRYKKAETTQEAKLLTILVEFADDVDDDFTDSMVPTYWGSSECMPGNVQNGPKHNNLPDPGSMELEDNNSMWVPDFSPEHYNDMLFTSEGITDRVRTDLTGPDGEPGFDISGYTMKNMYEEMSQGAYTVSGEATPWVTVPHSEGWYGATRCFLNDEGEWEAGAYQGMQGHPDNPLGAGQLPIDAVAALAELDPDFPWEDYDVEDQSDRDGDGDLYEPDGVIDHVVLVHAGADKSGGGGDEGTYALWAHSSAVAGGADIPGTDLKLSNYIVQPEDSGVGVFAHEYGHDLGLPDLYDTSGGGDSDVDFWDLMSSGSHAGPIFQSMPTHMGVWDKYVLGWADPLEIEPGDERRMVRVGQNSRPLRGTEDGIKINLPDKELFLTEPHSGENSWYTGADQDWADVRLSRTLDVPAGTEATFSMWNDYVIEADWDYGFVEVSTDGGATWDEVKVYDAEGAEVTTGDAYGDPNGRLGDFGGKQYGLTGSSQGWAQHFVDLSAHAGSTVDLRLRYATDAAFLERGWFADDFALVVDGETVWSDDTESGANGWTNEVSTWVDTTGQGWHADSGSSTQAQYYIVEWRNADGFDEGLEHAYDSTYAAPQSEAWKVEKFSYNVPGMLVWYRDTTYGDANHVTSNLSALPSLGAKGGLLIVDSHFDPLRRDASAEPDESVLKNLPSRPQSSNAAFGLRPTSPLTECIVSDDDLTQEFCTDIGPLAPVRTFTDDKGWYPGVEVNGESLFYRDNDASVTVPSVGNSPYSFRIVDPDGNLLPDWFGEDFGFPAPAGTGDPADDGVGYGTTVKLHRTQFGDRVGLISVTPPSVP
ncbi:immune inhibitor A domain-containing protein [Myceligenerans xiligouense]|uniref:Immune inhibitor A n=1 Tax=Myceligenerans xiligouense TaxID=253184 RepID=A0A3N4ZFQ7_9MICO|nr:immune inhibitor A domain-containing protein [Myceligenerans xiligouense]RPF19635.1 immune inhibitor A [Myceligenerans xiligouense]